MLFRVTSFFNPLPDDKILDSSKLKECADENFKFDKNTHLDNFLALLIQSGQNGQSYLPFIKTNVMFDFVYTKSIICKYRPDSTKLGQNIYVQQNLNEFDRGSDWPGTTGVICS